MASAPLAASAALSAARFWAHAPPTAVSSTQTPTVSSSTSPSTSNPAALQKSPKHYHDSPLRPSSHPPRAPEKLLRHPLSILVHKIFPPSHLSCRVPHSLHTQSCERGRPQPFWQILKTTIPEGCSSSTPDWTPQSQRQLPRFPTQTLPPPPSKSSPPAAPP